MEIKIDLFSPVVLILIGIGFLLANLGILPLNPWEAFVAYWPILLILFGLKLLLDFFYRLYKGSYTSVSELILYLLLIGFGVYLFAPRVGYPVPTVSWSLIWPSLLILFGLGKVLSSRRSIQVYFHKDKSYGAEGKFSLIGEVHRGGSSWKLDDMYLRHLIGEIHLDLTQAIIPEREITLDIGGWVGDVNIYLPADLPIKAHCRTNIGDVSVLDVHEDGIGKTVSIQSPNYDSAAKKVNLNVKWKIGEVKVRRIG